MICLKCGHRGPTDPENLRCPLCDESRRVMLSPDDILGPDNTLGLTPREAQLDMSDIIADFVTMISERQMDQSQPPPDKNLYDAIYIEAGTGTGKSLAYLAATWTVPDVHVVVSTSTKALGQQLEQKDGRLLERKLGGDIVALLGKGNYLCAYDYDFDLDDLSEAEGDDALVGRIWSRTEGGKSWHLDDPNEAKIVPRVERCESHCPHAFTCAYYQARYNTLTPRSDGLTRGANVIVTNHAFIASNLVYKRSILDDAVHPVIVVIDEAHKFVEVLRSTMSAEVTLAELRRVPGLEEYVDAIAWPKDKGFHDLEGQEQLKKYAQLRNAISSRAAMAEQEKTRIIRQSRELYSENVYAMQDPSSEPRAHLSELKRAAEEYAKEGRKARRMLRAIPRVYEGTRYTEEGTRVLVDEKFYTLDVDDDYAFYVQDDTLYRKPYSANFGALLRSVLPGKTPHGFVFCSATMTFNGSFDRFIEEVNIPAQETLQLPAPFDYKKQSFTLLCPKARAQAFTKNYRDPVPWWDTVGAYLTDLYTVHEGTIRSVILCASREDEFELARRLRPKLGGKVAILTQEAFRGRGGAGALVQTYTEVADRGSNVIMLGVASLWEGVSLEGNLLTSVIIPRVTFPYQGDLYMQLRSDRLERAGKSPFVEISLPYAVDNIRQGAGRLIRTVDDYGFVALLDGRVWTKRWGDTIVNNLPTRERRTSSLKRVEKVTASWI